MVTSLVESGPGDRRFSDVPVNGHLVNAALVAACELADLARDRGTRLRLAIDDHRIADLVRRATTGTVRSPLEVVDRFGWQIARLFADLYDTRVEAEPAEERLPLLVIGMDGSANSFTGAWAWVGSEGQHGWGPAASSLIDVCELEAIWQALRQAGDREALVLTDSRHAVRFVRRPDAGSGRVVDMALRVRDVMGRRARAGFDSRIAWARGHAGVG